MPQARGRVKLLGAASLAFTLLTALPSAASLPRAPFRVVIDPGHGGSDHGTIFDNGTVRVAEKDITLALATEAARQLRARGAEVTLTREKDRDVSLPSRTAVANRLRADVFISLHMNSTATPMVSDAEGVETFILNTATDASSRRLAHLENNVLGGSELGGGDTEVALILKDLRLDANLTDSKRLACSLQSSLVVASAKFGKVRHMSVKDRGVKQALFHVLLGADMPSALVEAGFLTSPRDRAVLLSIAGRKALGGALASAIDKYRRSLALPGASGALAELGRCKVTEQTVSTSRTP